MLKNYKYEDILIDNLDIEHVRKSFCIEYNINLNDVDNIEKKIKYIIKNPEQFFHFIEKIEIDKLLFIKFALSISLKIFNKRMIDFIKQNYLIKI